MANALTTDPPSKKSSLRFMDGLFLIGLLAHLPMMAVYCRFMWSKGHYQFFPLFFAAVGWLAYDRLSKYESAGAQNSKTIVSVLLIADACLLTLSAILYSAVFILPALMLFFAAWVVYRFGVGGFRLVLPIWLLLLIVVKMPGNLDQTLIHKMQFLSSQMASWILDAFGQVHFREGVTLVTEKKQFFTEEACSGVRSLFSSLAAIAIYGIIRHYSLARHVFNLAQTVVWALAGNAIRIAITVFVADNWTDAIASGTNHEMFGLGIFVFIFLMALSTDGAVSAFLRKSSTGALQPDRKLKEPASTPDSIVVPTNAKPSLVQWGILVAFCVIFLFSARLTYVKTFSELQRGRLSELEGLKFQQTDLPSSVNGWDVVEFDRQLRDESSLLAPASCLWTLKKNNRQAVVSWDSPYPGFHDLSICYNGLGWSVSSTHEYKKNELGQIDGISTVVIDQLDRFGVVYFSAFTRNGQMIDRPAPFSISSRARSAIENIKEALGMESDANFNYVLPNRLLPVSQLQIIYEQPSELSQSEKDEIIQLYLTVRDILVTPDRFPTEY